MNVLKFKTKKNADKINLLLFMDVQTNLLKFVICKLIALDN